MGPVSVSIRRFGAAREARSALRAATNASFRSLASPARALRRPALLLAAFATAAKHAGHVLGQLIAEFAGIMGHGFFSALTNSVLPSGAIATAGMVVGPPLP